MSAEREPLQVGDVVGVSVGRHAATGKVVSHWLADRRQVLTISFEDGSRHALVIDLDQCDNGGSTVIVGPVDIVAARQIALTLLSGRRPLLPVAAEANVLAAAVIALTGDAA